jgi:hypothetical protein
MKKISICIAAILLLCCALCLSALAAETQTVDGVEYQYEVVDGAARILSYTPAPTEWTVPETLGGAPVGTVAVLMPQTRSLILPATVKTVTENVRNGSSMLLSISVSEDNPALCLVDGVLLNKEKTQLVLYPKAGGPSSFCVPETVTSVPAGFFQSCNLLEEISLPAGVTEIGANAFAYCEALRSVAFAGAPQKIGKDAFLRCSALAGVDLGDPVHWCETDFADRQASPMHLKPQVLSGGSPLTALSVPEPVAKVSAWAFENCADLQTLTMADSVKSIGDYAFRGCSALRDLTMPRYLEAVGEKAFAGCDALESFLLPLSLKTLGKNVLTAASHLKVLADCSGLMELLGFEEMMPAGSRLFARAGAVMPDLFLFRGISVTELHPEDCARGIHCLDYYTPTVIRKPACTVSGQEAVECLLCNEIVTRDTGYAHHEMEYTTVPATTEADGELHYHCKNCSYAAVDVLPRIKTIRQQGTVCSYTGKPTAISFYIVRTDGRQLYLGENYTVRYENNTEVGTATATVVFKGLYAGAHRFTYQIVPAKTALVKQKDASASSVTIAWRKVKGAQSYKVYRYDKAQKSYVPVLETAKNKAKLKKLESGTTYSLRVYAVRKGVQGVSSAVLKAATAPTAPQVKLKALKGGVLRVSWTRPKGSSGYLLLIGVDPTMEEAVVAEIPDKKTNRLDLPGLPRGETYYVQVLAYRAVNDDAVLSKPSGLAKLRLA